LRARHRPFALDLPPLPESAIQKAVFQHLATGSAAHTFAFHVPNGGWRSPIEAAILKGMGLRPGVLDLVIMPRADGYRRRRARRWKRCALPEPMLESHVDWTRRCAG
jgi:hypothetical protein